MKPEVHQCPGCQKVRRFGEWIEPPPFLKQEIKDLAYRLRYVWCDTCDAKFKHSNRLLPVADN